MIDNNLPDILKNKLEEKKIVIPYHVHREFQRSMKQYEKRKKEFEEGTQEYRDKVIARTKKAQEKRERKNNDRKR